MQDLSPDLCSFYDYILQDKDDKIPINNKIACNEKEDENLIDETGKRKKINDILSDKDVKISNVLENIMEDVNIFDRIYQEEQDKIENEEVKIEAQENISKKELKYIYFQQSKENEKIKEKENTPKPIIKNRIYPIEMIDKIEKDYNNILIENIKKETKETDLYPLDTYKKNNELKIPLLLEQEKDIQFQSLKEKMLIKEIKNNNTEEVFSTFIIDKPNQEPGSKDQIYMYAGTFKGKIIKVLLNNKKTQNNTNTNDNISEIFDSKEDCINSIDIFENIIVTGHQNGSILFWEDNKILDKKKNIFS